MKAIYDVSAPAKLNLFLHVTGRRPDGYHLLQSVFMLIDWCDTLHFEIRPGAAISREDLSSTLPADDLIVRAAKALQAATGSSRGAHIGIDKKIPAQAGMGGGSSDAASTLLALNRLWQLNLPLQELKTIGLQLGADVPFFLGGHNAWVEGIGEKITPIELPTAHFVVVKPPSGLETAKIFSHPELKRDSATAIMTGFAANPFAFGRNDLQSVACQLCPQVDEALKWLQLRLQLGLQSKFGALDADAATVGLAEGVTGRMTGSGSAVFAPLSLSKNGRAFGKTLDEALALPPDGFVVRKCSNLQTHPLLDWACG